MSITCAAGKVLSHKSHSFPSHKKAKYSFLLRTSF